MKKNDAIDTLALGGKIIVEGSTLDTDCKENVTFGIDVGKEVLKEIIKTPEEEFIEYAKKCCIQKITIDVYCSNLYYYVYFNFLGGDIIRFCDMFRIKVLSGSENKIFESSIIDKGLVHVWHNEFNF